MTTWAIIFIGGGMGSICRYLLAKQFNEMNANVFSLPYGTFLANILACFILGVIMQKQTNGSLSEDAKLLFATGFCGGFSTFSTFGYEIYTYLQKGALAIGIAYVMASLILGIFALWLGMKCVSI